MAFEYVILDFAMNNTDRIRIVTSGWSYPRGEGTWNGDFYPPRIKSELEYYSRFFNAVEVNSTFYRPPDPHVSEGWQEKPPTDFSSRLNCGRNSPSGHVPRGNGRGGGDIRRRRRNFQDRFRPAGEKRQTGSALSPVPSQFHRRRLRQTDFEGDLNTFTEYRLAVELRHKSWSDDPCTAEILIEHNACWVQIDEPKFDFSIASEVPPTSDISYFRFHDRNAEMWWKGDVETRYMYLYSEAGINQLAQKVAGANANSTLTFAFFNNHYKANASRNARDLVRALQVPFNNSMDFRLPE